MIFFRTSNSSNPISISSYIALWTLLIDMLASVPQDTGMMYDTRIPVNPSIYSIC